MATEIVVGYVKPLQTSTQVVVSTGLNLTTNLTQLQDVDNYAGQFNKYARVKTDGTGIEWVDVENQVFGRNVIQFINGVTYNTYVDNGKTKYPFLRINGKNYLPTVRDVVAFTITSETITDNGDGTIVVTTSGGNKIFSSFDAEAVPHVNLIQQEANLLGYNYISARTDNVTGFVPSGSATSKSCWWENSINALIAPIDDQQYDTTVYGSENFWRVLGIDDADTELENEGVKETKSLKVWFQQFYTFMKNLGKQAIKAKSGITWRNLEDRFDDFINIKDFGAVGDGVTRCQDAWDAARVYAETNNVAIYIPSGTYLLSNFGLGEGMTVYGDGWQNTRMVCKVHNGSSVVKGGMSSNTVLRGVMVDAGDENLEWARFSLQRNDPLTDGFIENVVIEDCGFVGFTHHVPAPNAWGLYLDGVKNVDIINCVFDNNSQADIAMTDYNYNVRIISPYSLSNSLVLNIEPNDVGPNVMVTIENCRCKKLYTLLNTRNVDTIRKLFLKNVHAETWMCDGADIHCDGFTYDNIQTDPNQIMMGTISSVGGMGIGKNLAKNPRPLLVSSSEDKTHWYLGYSTIGPVDRYAPVRTDRGRCIRLNPTFQSGVVWLYQNVPVTEGEDYMFAITSETAGTDTNHNASICKLDWYNGATYISTDNLRGARSSTEEDLVKTEMAILKAPAGATSVQFTIMNAESRSGIGLDVYAATVHKVYNSDAAHPFDSIIYEDHKFTNGSVRLEAKTWDMSYAYASPLEIGDMVWTPDVGWNQIVEDQWSPYTSWQGIWRNTSILKENSSPVGRLVPQGQVGQTVYDVTNGKIYTAVMGGREPDLSNTSWIEISNTL